MSRQARDPNESRVGLEQAEQSVWEMKWGVSKRQAVSKLAFPGPLAGPGWQCPSSAEIRKPFLKTGAACSSVMVPSVPMTVQL